METNISGQFRNSHSKAIFASPLSSYLLVPPRCTGYFTLCLPNGRKQRVPEPVTLLWNSSKMGTYRKAK